jgi:hypothetical protein
MAFLAALLFLLAFAVFSTAFDVAIADEPKPIVPWNRPAEIVDRKHGFGQAIDGMVGQLQGQLRQMGADAMQKLEALKQAMPAKFQELMGKAVQIFRGPSASEKEQWDKVSFS